MTETEKLAGFLLSNSLLIGFVNTTFGPIRVKEGPLFSTTLLHGGFHGSPSYDATLELIDEVGNALFQITPETGTLRNRIVYAVPLFPVDYLSQKTKMTIINCFGCNVRVICVKHDDLEVEILMGDLSNGDELTLDTYSGHEFRVSTAHEEFYILNLIATYPRSDYTIGLQVKSIPSIDSPAAISNRFDKVYDQHMIHDVIFNVESGIFSQYPNLMEVLQLDVKSVKEVVPVDSWDLIISSPRFCIWLNIDFLIGSKERPSEKRGVCTHLSSDWLTNNCNDPIKSGSIEVYNVDDYFNYRKCQPFMLLHEMAHIYHAVHLGLDSEHGRQIMDTYESAMATGNYRVVKHVDGIYGPHYACTNAHEYFAELSEAYFGVSDYEPFTRNELELFDPQGCRLIEKMWSLSSELGIIEIWKSTNS